MNIYSASIFSFSVGVLVIAVLALIKRKDIVSIRFALFSVNVCGWGFPTAMWMTQAYSPETLLTLMRIAHAFGVFIPITWLHFVFTFIERKEPIKYFYLINYIISAVMALLSPTPLYIKGLHSIMEFKYFTAPGPLYHVYTTFFFVYVPYAFFHLMKVYYTSIGQKREQLKFLIIGTVIGFSSGATVFCPVYHIPFIFLGCSLMVFYPFFVGVALIKYGLFDVEQIANAFQREKLASLGLLTASINHEIRNPLYAARGALENYLELQKDNHPKSAETPQKALDQINRALEVITKLNRFSKPVDNLPANISETKISEAIQNVLDLVSYEFSLDKIQIHNRLPKNTPQIFADQRQIEEIFLNLIINAFHAMSQGGELTLSCHPERSEGSKIQIMIQDTGSGISDDQVKHIFEPFYTTKGEKGTGLGLYITKQLVERNGGKISVSSKTGQGTTFTLEFKTV